MIFQQGSNTMKIDGITTGKIAAEMRERCEEMGGSDGELMDRGRRCILALGNKLIDALIDNLEKATDETKDNATKLSERGASSDVELSESELHAIRREPRVEGLVPDFVVATQRINTILMAMHRYLRAERSIPSYWFDELESQSRTLDLIRENRKI